MLYITLYSFIGDFGKSRNKIDDVATIRLSLWVSRVRLVLSLETCIQRLHIDTELIGQGTMFVALM